MLKLWATIVIILLAGAAAFGYYNFLYPPNLLRHKTQHALDTFSKAVATKDRIKIGDTLKLLLTDNAQVRLEISFFSLSQANAGKPAGQDFDRTNFITFVDNILYSLQDYAHTADLQTFTLAADKKSAAITFTASQWADGASYYGGISINTRFTADTICEGNVLFENSQPMMNKLSCGLKLHSVPKPGEERKMLQNPEALKELLR